MNPMVSPTPPPIRAPILERTIVSETALNSTCNNNAYFTTRIGLVRTRLSRYPYNAYIFAIPKPLVDVQPWYYVAKGKMPVRVVNCSSGVLPSKANVNYFAVFSSGSASSNQFVSWPSAGHTETYQIYLVRANQRDLYHVSSLRDQTETVIRSWFGLFPSEFCNCTITSHQGPGG